MLHLGSPAAASADVRERAAAGVGIVVAGLQPRPHAAHPTAGHEAGCSLQAIRNAREGKRRLSRDAQFEYIHRQLKRRIGAHLNVNREFIRLA